MPTSLTFLLAVVAKYVYYEGSIALTQDEMEKNELIERVLREGFVRIRQLLVCAWNCLIYPVHSWILVLMISFFAQL